MTRPWGAEPAATWAAVGEGAAAREQVHAGMVWPRQGTTRERTVTMRHDDGEGWRRRARQAGSRDGECERGKIKLHMSLY
jgi:hypothetical protein